MKRFNILAPVTVVSGLITGGVGFFLTTLEPQAANAELARLLQAHAHGLTVGTLTTGMMVLGVFFFIAGLALALLGTDDVTDDNLKTGAGITTGIGLMNRK